MKSKIRHKAYKNLRCGSLRVLYKKLGSHDDTPSDQIYEKTALLCITITYIIALVSTYTQSIKIYCI